MSDFMTFEFNNDLISKKTIEINEEKEGNSFFKNNNDEKLKVSLIDIRVCS